MKKTTTIIIVAALLCGIIAAGAFFALSGSWNRPKPEDATVSSLLEIQKKPSADYIDYLEQVIRKNRDQTVRDVAVNTLTSITIRRGETDKVMGFLKDLTVSEKDPAVMSAAHTGIDRIREKYPLPPMGALDVSVNGNIRKGGEVTISATFSSTTNIDSAVLSLDYPGNSVESIDHPLYYTSLAANIPVTHAYRIRLLATGEYKVPVNLMVSTDRTDYEQLQQTVVFTVRENNGEYTLV
jgi:hypothetical protein